MKTKIIAFVLCLICLFALVSLTSCSAPGDTVHSSEYVNFEILETSSGCGIRILVDRTTGVLYYHYIEGNASGITPLYNADGSLKNIKDFE